MENVYNRRKKIWDGPADDDPIVVDYHRPLDKEIMELNQVNEGLKARNKALMRENADLRELLKAHEIPWPMQNGSKSIATFTSPAATPNNRFPVELQLRILGFALQLAHPIIDPGVKILMSNVTESEHAEQQHIPVQLLRVSKVFNAEGSKLLFRTNEFIFTQASSLRWLIRTHPNICEELEHLELRVVGKYYNDSEECEDDLIGFDGSGEEVKMNCIKRCPNLNLSWTGLQSYCWRQIVDLLKCLEFSGNYRKESASRYGTKSRIQRIAFKNLKSMMIDLANFTDELPGPGVALRKLTRETIGPIVDEIYIRGLTTPQQINSTLAAQCLGYLLRDGGVKGQNGRPYFRSTFGCEYLETTNGLEYNECLYTDIRRPATILPNFVEKNKEEKYIWKELSRAFGVFEGRKVRFHIWSGFPVDADIRVNRSPIKNLIMFVDKDEKWLDAYQKQLTGVDVRWDHDQDLEDHILERIYGPDKDNGGGVGLGVAWASYNMITNDPRPCDNCKDMYGYLGTELHLLGRSGDYGDAEYGFLWEVSRVS